MKDPFNLFIEDSVYYSSNQYYKLIFKTKKMFFEYLSQNKSLEEFKKESAKIWNKVDHKYMEQRISELEKMIEARDLKGQEIINPNAEYTQVYDLVKEERFIEVEKKYKSTIDNYYKSRLKTVNKEYINKNAYLSKIVSEYDKTQAIIPYYNKDGTVRSYHNVASYNSMLYNTNLNRAGWNRTLYDSDLLDNDLLYLPAHPFACPLCMEWQGRIYSASGKSGYIDGHKYVPQEMAIAGGVGHPNCKHQWTIYWDKSQIQDNNYNSGYWEEQYENKQKIQSLQLERTKLKNDRAIYQSLNNYDEVDKANQKIKKLNSAIKELK